jgi:hypothetical protein
VGLHLTNYDVEIGVSVSAGSSVIYRKMVVRFRIVSKIIKYDCTLFLRVFPQKLGKSENRRKFIARFFMGRFESDLNYSNQKTRYGTENWFQRLQMSKFGC